jgi:hypothetical protein
VLSFVFIAVCAFRAPWRQHFAQAVVFNLCMPTLFLLLVTWLAWKVGFRNRSRYRRPSLVFLVGFPVVFTWLVMDLDLFMAWPRTAVSIQSILLADAAVILAYCAWTGIFLRIPKRPLPRIVS